MEWVKVEDSLPDDGVTVLVCTNSEQIYTCRKSVITEKNSRPPEFEYKVDRFTHWMPLPAPPSSDTQYT